MEEKKRIGVIVVGAGEGAIPARLLAEKVREMNQGEVIFVSADAKDMEPLRKRMPEELPVEKLLAVPDLHPVYFENSSGRELRRSRRKAERKGKKKKVKKL